MQIISDSTEILLMHSSRFPQRCWFETAVRREQKKNFLMVCFWYCLIFPMGNPLLREYIYIYIILGNSVWFMFFGVPSANPRLQFCYLFSERTSHLFFSLVVHFSFPNAPWNIYPPTLQNVNVNIPLIRIQERDVPLIRHGIFPMDFPWFSHGFSPWIFHMFLKHGFSHGFSPMNFPMP